MIRKNKAGIFYCDGRECGFDPRYTPPTDEEDGEVFCLDCGAGMFIGPDEYKRAMASIAALQAEQKGGAK